METQMKVQDTSETRELAVEELNSATGGVVSFGHGLGELVEWLVKPGNVKAWEAHLKSIL
jgi:hypothetical protein